MLWMVSGPGTSLGPGRVQRPVLAAHAHSRLRSGAGTLGVPSASRRQQTLLAVMERKHTGAEIRIILMVNSFWLALDGTVKQQTWRPHPTHSPSAPISTAAQSDVHSLRLPVGYGNPHLSVTHWKTLGTLVICAMF